MVNMLLLATCFNNLRICESTMKTDDPTFQSININDINTSDENNNVQSTNKEVITDLSMTPDEPKPKTENIPFSPSQIYQHLFKQKRLAHKEAMSSLLALEKYEKQYKMLKILLEQMFKVISTSRIRLMESGFIAGDDIPTEENSRDAFSAILENIAFFGDLLMHMPDAVSEQLAINRAWKDLSSWGWSFCNETNIFQTSDQTLLNLMGQELGILEKDIDYVNPYRHDKKKTKAALESQAFGKSKSDLKKKEKRKEKKKKKGPRLSNIPHTEL